MWFYNFHLQSKIRMINHEKTINESAFKFKIHVVSKSMQIRSGSSLKCCLICGRLHVIFLEFNIDKNREDYKSELSPLACVFQATNTSFDNCHHQ